MEERKRIGIYIDYALRIPNFKKTYELFKENLFKDNFDVTFEDDLIEDDLRFFWSVELKNPIIEKFYISKNTEKIDDKNLLGNFNEFFYNEEHLKKFLEEYSFNLYCDCDLTSLQDIHYLNTCQRDLFDVTLIDNFQTVRKISNTFFFLSKSRIYPRNVIFLGPKQQLNENNFLAVWNPILNKEQINSNDSDLFLKWLQELEKNEKK